MTTWNEKIQTKHLMTALSPNKSKINQTCHSQVPDSFNVTLSWRFIKIVTHWFEIHKVFITYGSNSRQACQPRVQD